MSGICRFSRKTQLRALREGHEAFRFKGPLAVNPYGGDERNGAWSQGRLFAKKHLSLTRAIIEFERMEDKR